MEPHPHRPTDADDASTSASRPPEALTRALGELFEVQPPSAALRARLALAARRELTPTLRPVGATRSPWRSSVGAAAAALLLVGLHGLRGPRLELDLNGDGRVDVLDARQLALAGDRGRALDGRFDLDGDGRTDRADAARLLERLVELPR